MNETKFLTFHDESYWGNKAKLRFPEFCEKVKKIHFLTIEEYWSNLIERVDYSNLDNVEKEILGKNFWQKIQKDIDVSPSLLKFLTVKTVHQMVKKLKKISNQDLSFLKEGNEKNYIKNNLKPLYEDFEIWLPQSFSKIGEFEKKYKLIRLYFQPNGEKKITFTIRFEDFQIEKILNVLEKRKNTTHNIVFKNGNIGVVWNLNKNKKTRLYPKIL